RSSDLFASIWAASGYGEGRLHLRGGPPLACGPPRTLSTPLCFSLLVRLRGRLRAGARQRAQAHYAYLRARPGAARSGYTGLEEHAAACREIRRRVVRGHGEQRRVGLV